MDNMLLRGLRFALSIVLVGWAVSLLDWDTIASTIRGGSTTALLCAMALNMLMFVVLGGRWYWMVARLSPAPFLAHLAIYLRATFLNTFTPANLGGDVYRTLTLKSAELSAGQMVKILIQERIIGLYGCLTVFFCAWLWISLSERTALPALYIWAAMVATCAFAVAIAAKVFSSAINRGICAIPLSERQRLRLLFWLDALIGVFSVKGVGRLLAVSVVAMLLWTMSIKVVADGFGLAVPALYLAAVAALVEIVRVIPMTIQGIGVREGVFAYLLGSLGQGSDQAYVVGVVAYLALSIAIVLTGPVGALLAKMVVVTKAPASM